MIIAQLDKQLKGPSWILRNSRTSGIDPLRQSKSQPGFTRRPEKSAGYDDCGFERQQTALNPNLIEGFSVGAIDIR